MFDFLDIYLLEAVINGVLLGGVLALLALGLNLIFGVIDVVWICYAELIMCGMYTVFYLHSVYHWPFLLAAIVALLGTVAYALGGPALQWARAVDAQHLAAEASR